jgi:D-alanyl-D-alanine dipeptidase
MIDYAIALRTLQFRGAVRRVGLLIPLLAILLPVDQPCAAEARAPAEGFVYLGDVDPRILQDIRYAGSHNFIGRPVLGYGANSCIVTAKAAEALKSVQSMLAGKNLSLIVWDCYRPVRAVRDFVNWSKDASDQKMKAEFYPRTDKSRFFALGYLATRSAHSRGSTVDLGLVPSTVTRPAAFDASAPLQSCFAPKGTRFEDGAIDFGTGYDCLDAEAGTAQTTARANAIANRQLLRGLMERAGFKPYAKEWWHFELKDEPFPAEAFDFPVSAPPAAPRR